MTAVAERLLARCDFPDRATGSVDLAVSGGADSLALVVLARMAGLDGRVVHVDHGLRPGSWKDGQHVAQAAAAFGFAFEQVIVDVGAGPNLEARARAARYRALPPEVLTGHTMDDQAETVLLNILRGGALDGLAAMRTGPGRPAVRRPLLGLRRADTAVICREAGLVALQDPSNDDPRFRRNRVRHDVIPLLCEVAGRDVVPILARQADIAGGEAELLDRLAADLEPTDARALALAPTPLVRRSLRTWIRGHGHDEEMHPPSSAEVGRILEVVLGTRRACEIAGGRRVERSGGRLRVVDPTEPVGQGVSP